MLKTRFIAVIILIASFGVGYFVYTSQSSESSRNFKLGLDLNGGTELVYKADVSALGSGDITSAMSALRDVIECRVNLFGVSEPIVQTESVGGIAGQGAENRLIVELPGVTDIEKAVALIGQTPLLEFKLLKKSAENLTQDQLKDKTVADLFEDTGLTGRYLKSSQLEFNQTTFEPIVGIQFNSDGEKLFASITKNNVGRYLAIFLDGQSISMPVIREEILGGKATISGGFTGSTGREEARVLVNNLNLGALPVPISLISTQTVGSTLGSDAVKASVDAGMWAFLVIAIFLILWYRLPGLVATVSLGIYVVINLALFKLIPVTLTAAGIAAFVLSLGMAVDANILIFERMKEEFRRGRKLDDAIREGFSRAWLSIRDSNISSMITAVVLYYFASTSVVKGFALVFFIGVLTSMLTAITVSRTLLIAIRTVRTGRVAHFLFSNGFTK
ncbi:MAG: protein translocase subunit SecD [Candidatus Paceibacterota bacterium]